MNKLSTTRACDIQTYCTTTKGSKSKDHFREDRRLVTKQKEAGTYHNLWWICKFWLRFETMAGGVGCCSSGVCHVSLVLRLVLLSIQGQISVGFVPDMMTGGRSQNSVRLSDQLPEWRNTQIVGKQLAVYHIGCYLMGFVTISAADPEFGADRGHQPLNSVWNLLCRVCDANPWIRCENLLCRFVPVSVTLGLNLLSFRILK